MPDNCAYLVAGKRSPTGKFLCSLSRLTPMEVGTQVAKALLDQTKADRNAFNEVFVGQVLQAGCGQNPARQVALGAGIHDTISCVTVNKVCGSGLQSVMFADQLIRVGDAHLILAGGIESMSQAPFLSRTMRGGNKFGHGEMVDEMLYDGLTNVYTNELMGEIAEYTAEKAGLTRQMQDEWALQSQQRAAPHRVDQLRLLGSGGAVVQLHAPLEPLQGVPLWDPFYPGTVLALDLEAGVGQAVEGIPLIREEE